MIFVLSAIFLTAIDFVSKILAVNFLKPVGTIEIMRGFFSLTYVENRGAAFGILQNARWVFILVTILASIAIILYKFKAKPQGITINTSLCLLISGAVGNLIDRVFKGYVVDMFEVTFINYPVFNIADIFVVTGAILLCVYVLFIYKEPKKED